MPRKEKKGSTGAKAKTPEPKKEMKLAVSGTPKSEPPLKRKLLSEEIDEELSDEDFEELLKGMKGKQKAGQKRKSGGEIVQTKKAGSEEDEEESDEDEDDEVMDSDEDDSDMDDDSEEGDKDDESDDDEEEEDDEEEDSEEEEEKTEQIKLKNTLKTNSKAKANNGISTLSPDSIKQDAKRKAEHDSRTLFVKNLPKDATDETIKELSSDIKEVRLRWSYQKSDLTRGYAFLQFASEKLADKNYKLLQGKSLGDRTLQVDYVGEKSSKKPGKEKKSNSAPADVDPLKLYITGFSSNMTVDTLKEMFPTSKKIDLPMKKSTKKVLGYSFVHFESADDCSKAHDSMQNKKHKGTTNVTMVVLYAKKKKEPTSKAQKKKQAKAKIEDGPVPAKKQKLVKEVEENEEDSDDEVDGEDESGEGEDDGDSDEEDSDEEDLGEEDSGEEDSDEDDDEDEDSDE